MANTVEIPVKIKFENQKIMADKLANEIESSLSKMVSGLGLGGAASGAALGGGIGLAIGMGVDMLGGIAKSLMDFPVIVGLAKVLKVIAMLLLMPLIPILKPLIGLLADFIKFIKPFIVMLTSFIEIAFSSEGLLKFFDIDNLKKIWKSMVEDWEWAVDLAKKVAPAFQYLIDSVKLIWFDYIKPAFKFLEPIGSWIWLQIIKPAFNFLANVGTWIWDIIRPPFQNLVNWLSSLVGKGRVYDAKGNKETTQADLIPATYPKNKSSMNFGTQKLNDFVVTPNGTISTHPDDFIFGMKNPKGMGGSNTINLYIDKPQLRSENDIKLLVKEIEKSLYTSMRRYNSYT